LESLLTHSFECQVSSAYDSNAAFEHIQANPVDLLILDINMPNSNSLYLVSRLQQDPQYQQIPIIMMSAMSYDEIQTAFKEKGVKYYFSKTTLLNDTEKQAFLDTVKNLLGV
jgi:two-component system chemotaxis sensor kinase CheA